MTERPIIFSAEMVRAILDGRKTQTRRVIKPQPWEWVESITFSDYQDCWQGHGYEAGMKTGTLLSSVGGPQKCPYGKPGDALWCKEKWAWSGDESIPKTERIKNREVWYKADGIYTSPAINWRNPLFMPKWAARLWLKVMGIRVERVQDISEEDARAEGFPDYIKGTDIKDDYIALRGFQLIWDSINKKRGFGWDVNPFVWIIEFERCTT